MSDDIPRLVDEVRLLFHQLVESGEALHRAEDVTIAMRAVLEYLHTNGPTTVPAIARARGVSRQHIQTLVNGLVAQNAVELVDNPAHKRSSLVGLTASGRKTIERMKRREARFFTKLELAVDRAELKRAIDTLRNIRASLKEAL